MTLIDTLLGALLFRSETFDTLRERSDVFLRGFLALLIVGLIVGFGMGLERVAEELTPPPTRERVIATALDSFRASYQGPSEIRPMIESYVTEITSMIYEIVVLPPRAGEVARPISSILTLIGTTLAVPFSWAWSGWLLFAGLLFHLTSRWLGGRAGIAQMLGLTALAAAPKLLLVLSSGLNILQTLVGIPLGFLVPLIGLVVAIWSAVIYVKATSMAQGFSWLRALGAIVLGYVVLIGVLFVLVILFGLLVSLVVVPIAGAVQ